MTTDPFDWAAYRVGGAMRPDSFTGMQDAFRTGLESMISAAPPEIQQELRVNSGYRSEQRQAELWEQALKKHGSPEAARKWVAPPGRSQHGKGNAADMKFLSPAAKAWVHENAGNFGLAFPLSNEPWHIELASARGGAAAAPAASGGQQYSMGYEPPSAPQSTVSPAPEETEEEKREKLFADISREFATSSAPLSEFSKSLRDRGPVLTPYQNTFGKVRL